MRSASRPAPLSGVVIQGELGQGGMSQVLLGAHRPARAPVAVKVLAADPANAPAVRQAFANEVRAVAALRHPGIVPILDYGEVDEAAAARHPALTLGAPFLVMPVALGGTAWALRRALTWPTLLAFTTLVLDALGHAHSRGVLHRDLKPSNVLLHDGRDLRAGLWLADFGLARRRRARYPDAVPVRGGGTMGFRAPEQAQPELGPEGPWTDLFALGRLLQALASDAATWQRPPPEGYWAWLERLLDPEPTARPRFAAEAADALAALDVNAPTRSNMWRPEPQRSTLDPSLSEAMLDLSEPAMVGRRAERDALWRALLTARTSRSPRLVVLRGAQGVGRSRLARWVADQAHEIGVAESVRASCRPDHVPGSAVAEALSELLNLDGAPLAEVEERLAELLPAWSVRDRARLAELMCPRAARAAEALVRPPGDRVFLLSRAVLDLSGQRPLVVLLDDAHLSQRALQLAQALLDSGASQRAPLFIVLSVADEHLATRQSSERALRALEQRPEVLTVEVPPLERGQHALLVRELLGPDHPQLGEVVQRTLGNPGFAVQLCRHLRDAPTSERAHLPPALQDVYTSRLQRVVGAMSASDRRGALLAALLGPKVWLALWADACHHAKVPASQRPLELLARAKLIVLQATQVRFDSSLLQDSLTQLATASELAALHAACAQALPLAEDEARAMHLYKAGALEEALPPMTRAFAHASRYLLLERSEVLGRMWSELVGRLALPPDHPERLSGEVSKVRILIGRGRMEEARDACLELEARAANDERSLLEVWRLLALAQWRLGHLDLYLQGNRRVAARAQGRPLARARLDLAYGLRALARFEDAEREAVKAQVLFERLGDDYNALDACRLQASLALSLRPGPATLRLIQRGREMAESMGANELLASLLIDESRAHRLSGELELAAEAALRCCGIMDQLGTADAVVPRIFLASVYNDMGRYGESRRLLGPALRRLETSGPPLYIGYLVVYLARALAGLKRWDGLQPGWLEADLSLAKVYPEELLGALRESAEAAEAEDEGAAATLLWGLLERAAEVAEAPEALAEARERILALESATRR